MTITDHSWWLKINNYKKVSFPKYLVKKILKTAKNRNAYF